MTAVWAVFRGFGLLFHIDLGYRYTPFLQSDGDDNGQDFGISTHLELCMRSRAASWIALTNCQPQSHPAVTSTSNPKPETR